MNVVIDEIALTRSSSSPHYSSPRRASTPQPLPSSPPGAPESAWSSPPSFPPSTSIRLGAEHCFCVGESTSVVASCFLARCTLRRQHTGRQANGSLSPASRSLLYVLCLSFPSENIPKSALLDQLSFSGTWAVTIRLYASEIQPNATRAAASSFGLGMFHPFTPPTIPQRLNIPNTLFSVVNSLFNFVVALSAPGFLAKSAYGTSCRPRHGS